MSFKTPRWTESSALWVKNETSGRDEGDPWARLGFPSNFLSPTPLQPLCVHWGALTLAAEMAPGRGCTCHAPHHSFDPGMFHWWGREFPVQQRTGSFLTTAHHSTRFAGNITSWADTSGFLSLCFNHLWLLNNNKDSLSTCFKQDAKRRRKKINKQLGEQINGD